MKTSYIYLLIISLLWLPTACNKPVASYTEAERYAAIHPSYESTCIPYNIAPLNFSILEKGSDYLVRFVAPEDSFEVRGKRNILIPVRKWKKILSDNRGGEVQVKIFTKEDDNWIKFNDLIYQIAPEPIDPYIAYRLIEPGYEVWGKMGIYQRCIENFDETPIIENSLTDGSCMNCHSFRNNNPDYMTFHIRGKNAGTIFVKDGKISKVDTKPSWGISAGVYPRWHPDGRYVAFSTNNTSQLFRMEHTNKIEVFDAASDVIVYDTRQNHIFTCDLLKSADSFETFPEWSPDGKFLYFCSAVATNMPKNFAEAKYSLLRIGFDPETGNFNNHVDTLVSASRTNKSVSMPRISPDGRYLLFCLADYGTFPIWHRENDLHKLDLLTGEFANLTETNSSQSDSYHSWSTNGRWILFASRRMDETYTRPYLAYFDSEGNGHSAFVVPQKHPEHYDLQLKSYNIPEFMTGKVKVSPYEFEKIIKGAAEKTAE